MKTLLTVLVSLLTLTSYAQGVQNVRVRSSSSGPVLYNVQVKRDLTLYPIPSGSNSFTTAVATRALSATVTCPCGERPVIAAGQLFPTVAPCTDNCTTTPTWASSWYDYNGSVLTVRATGDDMLLRFERQDGQAFTTTNPDNVPINNLDFYDHATFNNGTLYQWQINFQNAPPLKLTYKRKSDNSIYQLTFTPANGASNLQLFQASTGGGGSCDYTLAVNSPTISCSGTAYLTATASGTAASGLSYTWTGPNSYTASGASIAVSLAQNGTYPYTVTATKTGCSAKQATATVNVSGCSSQTALMAFSNGYIFGNSFTYAGSFGAWPNNNGMAASSLANDYAHKLEATLQTVNPSFHFYAGNQGSPWEGATYSYLDNLYDYPNRITGDLNYIYSGSVPNFDLVLISIGENINDGTFNKTKYFAGLDSLLNRLPKTANCKIVLRGAFWSGHTLSTSAAQEYATAHGYTFVDFSDIVEKPEYQATNYTDAGIRHHWNDLGHAEIARRFAAALTTSTPTSGGFAWQEPTDNSWDGYKSETLGFRSIRIDSILTQENDQLRIELRKGFGGAIQIYDKVSQQNLINFYDQGRESGYSSYGFPLNFGDANNPDPTWTGIGYNGLPPGDTGGNPSVVLKKGHVDGWLFTKAQLLQWSRIDATRIPMYYSQWVKVNGNRVDVKVKIEQHRPDKTFYEPRSQEWPFMMINGARRFRFYNGSNPYTFASSQSTDGFESGSAQVNGVKMPGAGFYVTEPWIGVDIATNRMIGLVTKYHRSTFNVDAWQAYSLNEGGNTLSYVQFEPLAHLDPDNTWYFEYSYVIGTEAQVRQAAYDLPRQNVPDFHFTQAAGRNGWVIFDGGHDQSEPFSSDNWKVVFDGKTETSPENPNYGQTYANNTKLVSPASCWKASDCPTIYIRMKYSGSQSQLQLQWLRQGFAPNGADGSYPNRNSLIYPNGNRPAGSCVKPFMVYNDNQWHTYAIPVSQSANWQGYIHELEIIHAYNVGNVPPGEQFEISYIGYQNPGN